MSNEENRSAILELLIEMEKHNIMRSHATLLLEARGEWLNMKTQIMYLLSEKLKDEMVQCPNCKNVSNLICACEQCGHTWSRE